MQLNQAPKTDATQSQPSSDFSVRSQIANATQKAHEALHVHAIIGRLLAPDIRPHEYRAILSAYLSFYQCSEDIRKRYALMPALSFVSDLGCLHEDLAVEDTLPPLTIPISSSLQALGMLYVLHGSRFGGMEIYRNLKTTMPLQKHAFFRQRPNKLTWHALLARMEEQQGQSANISEIAVGSAKTFDAFDQWLLLAKAQ